MSYERFALLPYMKLKRFLLGAGVVEVERCTNKAQVIAIAVQRREIDYTPLLQDTSAQRATEATAASKRRAAETAEARRLEDERRKAREQDAADRIHVQAMAPHYSCERLMGYVVEHFDALLEAGFGRSTGDSRFCYRFWLRRADDDASRFVVLRGVERSSIPAEHCRLDRSEATAFMTRVLRPVLQYLQDGLTIDEARAAAITSGYTCSVPDTGAVRRIVVADWQTLPEERSLGLDAFQDRLFPDAF